MSKRRERLRKVVYGPSEVEKQVALEHALSKLSKSLKSSVYQPTATKTTVSWPKPVGPSASELMAMPDGEERQQAIRQSLTTTVINPEWGVRVDIPYERLDQIANAANALTDDTPTEPPMVGSMPNISFGALYGGTVTGRFNRSALADRQRIGRYLREYPREPMIIDTEGNWDRAAVQNYSLQSIASDRMAMADFGALEARVLANEQRWFVLDSVPAPRTMGVDLSTSADQTVRFEVRNHEIGPRMERLRSTFGDLSVVAARLGRTVTTAIQSSREFEGHAEALRERVRRDIENSLLFGTSEGVPQRRLSDDILSYAEMRSMMREHARPSREEHDALHGLPYIPSSEGEQSYLDWYNELDESPDPSHYLEEAQAQELRNMIGDFDPREVAHLSALFINYMLTTSPDDGNLPEATVDRDFGGRRLRINLSIEFSYADIEALVRETGDFGGVNKNSMIRLLQRKTEDELSDREMLKRLMDKINNTDELREALTERSPRLMRVINQRLADPIAPLTPKVRNEVANGLRDTSSTLKAKRRQLTVRKAVKSENTDLD